MASSLQDQLLKAGLRDAKQAKAVNKEKRKQVKMAKSAGVEVTDEVKVATQQAAREKAERDRQANAARDQAAARKAINAQIKQLIAAHEESRQGAELSFNFTDGSKIKKMLVTGVQRGRLISGLLKIVKQGDSYAIVPAPIADKIAQRDPARVIDCRGSNEPELTAEEQDWYKDFEIPDDLDW